jgi:putative PIN family toxin of toxin-antitoxin system
VNVVRAVLDTSVYVRALINPASRCGRLLFQYADQYTIVVSVPIAQELLDVINRPELMSKSRGLARFNMRKVIDVVAKAEAVTIDSIPAVVRDPNDDMFIATAVAGSVDYVVSEDLDLLTLRQVGDIQIVNSGTFIRLFEDM